MIKVINIKIQPFVSAHSLFISRQYGGRKDHPTSNF